MPATTRDRLIESAKALFIHNGWKTPPLATSPTHQTKVGASSTPTSFKNNLEIFRAVIERESEIIGQGVDDLSAIIVRPPFPLDTPLARNEATTVKNQRMI